VPITVSSAQLAGRPQAVSGMLRRLRTTKPVGCLLLPEKIEGGKVVSAFESRPDRTGHRNNTFRTACSDLLAQYFELWRESTPADSWRLEKAYLNLFLIDRQRQTQGELVSVHCDPFESGPGARFKQGPHLHVKAASHPLPRAHFPLNLSHLHLVIASVGSLTVAMTQAIEVIRAEVVDRYAS